MAPRFLILAVAAASALALAAEERFLPWMDENGKPFEFFGERSVLRQVDVMLAEKEQVK